MSEEMSNVQGCALTLALVSTITLLVLWLAADYETCKIPAIVGIFVCIVLGGSFKPSEKK